MVGQTFQQEEFLSVAGSFAKAELEALRSANPDSSTLLLPPYTGIQFVPIPEFVSIAGATGQQISEALQGKVSVEQALSRAQTIALRKMKRSGN